MVNALMLPVSALVAGRAKLVCACAAAGSILTMDEVAAFDSRANMVSSAVPDTASLETVEVLLGVTETMGSNLSITV